MWMYPSKNTMGVSNGCRLWRRTDGLPSTLDSPWQREDGRPSRHCLPLALALALEAGVSHQGWKLIRGPRNLQTRTKISSKLFVFIKYSRLPLVRTWLVRVSDGPDRFLEVSRPWLFPTVKLEKMIASLSFQYTWKQIMYCVVASVQFMSAFMSDVLT
jgi:hypothetical protein